MSIGYLPIKCIRKACRISTTLRTDSLMDIPVQLVLQKDQLIGNRGLVGSSILDKTWIWLTIHMCHSDNCCKRPSSSRILYYMRKSLPQRAREVRNWHWEAKEELQKLRQDQLYKAKAYQNIPKKAYLRHRHSRGRKKRRKGPARGCCSSTYHESESISWNLKHE